MRQATKKRRRHRRSRAPLWGGLLALALLLIFMWYGGRTKDEAGATPPGGAQASAKGPQAGQSGAEPGADCPQVLKDLLDRNPETTDFVAGYPGAAPGEIDLSADYTPGEIPAFFQWDTRSGYGLYGGNEVGDLMGLSGCGPTALSMVAVGLTGNMDYHPWAVAQYAGPAGYAVPGQGTAWTLMSEGCSHFGLQAREVPLWEDDMIQALEDGEPIICCVGPGDFTTKGHFIVLYAYEDGLFWLHDPNSKANSQRGWSYETLEPQILALWAYSLEEGA